MPAKKPSKSWYRPVPSRTDHPLYPEIRSCSLCRLRADCQGPVPGVGNPAPYIMLVGEAPGENEDRFGIPFTGASWRELEGYLRGAGLERNDVYITNTVKCVDGNQKVYLADGTLERINRLVKDQYTGEVLSYDEFSGEIVSRRVTGWYRSPRAGRPMLRVSYRLAKGNRLDSHSGVTVTEDHLFLTRRGWIAARDLTDSDEICTGLTAANSNQRAIILGTMLGDGYIERRSSALTITHTGRQMGYSQHLAEAFSSLGKVTVRSSTILVAGKSHHIQTVRLQAIRQMAWYREQFYPDQGIKRVPFELLEQDFSDLALAVWYMDDGYLGHAVDQRRKPYAEIATAGFPEEDVDHLVDFLNYRGLSCVRSRRNYIRFSAQGSQQLFLCVAKYIVPCMRYKLPEFHQKSQPFAGAYFAKMPTKVLWDTVGRVEGIPNYSQGTVYCIDVEGTGNFVTPGGVIHNCRPAGDPAAADAAMCAPIWLETEIALYQPKIIVALGQLASRYLLGDPSFTLGEGHGYPVFDNTRRCWILPAYHPAAGLHSPMTRPFIEADFRSLRELLSGNPRRKPEDGWGRDGVRYRDWARQLNPVFGPDGARDYAFDTETDPGNRLWCFSVSAEEGAAGVYDPNQVTCWEEIAADPSRRVVLHNAPFDLLQLRQLGVRVQAEIHDTLLMARLLQLESGRLKDLSRRRLGMEMEDYRDVIASAEAPVAIPYLQKALGIAAAAGFPAPLPETTLRWSRKDRAITEKTRHPQPLGKKLARLLAELADGKTVDVAKRWRDWGEETAPIEAALGPLPVAYLAHVPRERAVFYSARDADATLRLFRVLEPEVREAGLWDCYRMDMEAVPLIVEMMAQGIQVDRPYLEELNAEFGVQKEIASALAQGEAGIRFNVSSGEQKEMILFDHLGLPSGRTTPGGMRSTDDEVLIPLRGKHPIVPLLLDHSRYEKMQSAYTGPILDFLDVGDRCHCDYSGMAITGRLTAKDPNLMAIPKRSEDGKKVRNAFTTTSAAVQSYLDRGFPPPDALMERWREDFGGEETTLLSLDFSQVEMRLMAHESRCQNLLNAFWSGQDVHQANASGMFRVAYEAVSKAQRDAGKGVGFGTIYGITADGILRQFEVYNPGVWTLSECERLLADYFRLNPEVKQYMESQAAYSRRHGYVRDMFGRRRLLPEIHASSPALRSEAERFAANFPIQAGAQGVMKLAMAEVWRQMEAAGETGSVLRFGVPLLQIHDQLVFEVRKSAAQEYAAAVKGIMESRVRLDVALPVDISTGDRLGSLKE